VSFTTLGRKIDKLAKTAAVKRGGYVWSFRQPSFAEISDFKPEYLKMRFLCQSF
jgi:hypothetical protein